VEPANLRLGCTPAVNLFPRTADPIRLAHNTVEYQVLPDARALEGYEVHSVERVTSVTPGTGETVQYDPFYGTRHGGGEKQDRAYWRTVRRPSMRKGDSGSDIFISLVNPNFDVLSAPVDVLHVETLCTNRSLPNRLPFGAAGGDFRLEGRPGIKKITAIRKPTDSLAAPVSNENRWRLISHLSLNYLSIFDSSGNGITNDRALEALHEILRIYDFADSPVTRQRIAGLVGLSSRRIVRRVGQGISGGYARGLETVLEFDPSQYTGAGVFLFASVLERFLGLYTSVNSFTQTVAKVRHRPGELKRWAPRAGELALL
jgi:type VI secretion system protein ImpG